jgi:hypothetical protein
MSNKATQREMILRYIREFGSITPHEALREFGCMRLGARIWELRKSGYLITRTMEKRENRYGKKIAYARYSIPADQ